MHMHEVLGPSTQAAYTACTYACMHQACTTRLQLRIGGVVGGLELLLRHRVLALALGQVAQLARVLQEALDAVGLDILHDDQGLLSSRRVDRLEARSRDLLGRDRAQSRACFRLDREHAVDCGSCRSARSGSSEEVAVDGVKETTGRWQAIAHHGPVVFTTYRNLQSEIGRALDARPTMSMLRALVTRPLLARPLRPLLARLPLATAQSRMAKSSGFDLSRPVVGPRPKRAWKLHGFSMDVDFPAVKALLKERDAARPEARLTGDYSVVDALREQAPPVANVASSACACCM